MSEQPTRAEIEEALGSFLNTWEEKVLSWAARQYLASLDAPAPLQNVKVGQFPENPVDVKPIPGSPKDGTREPPVPIIDEMDPRHVSNPGTGAHVLDHRSPPVPQEGVSDKMVSVALAAFDSGPKDSQRIEENMGLALEAALAPLLEENARLKQMDSEAATYVESVICMRTDFTGEPPYVGWKGLGLALTEALDERDTAEARVKKLQREFNVVTELYNAGRGAEARVNEHEVVLNSYAEENQRLFDRAERAEARVKELEGENAKQREVSNFHFVGQAAAEARVKELEAYAKHERSLGAEAVAIEALGTQQILEARVRELETALNEALARSADWHWVKEKG